MDRRQPPYWLLSTESEGAGQAALTEEEEAMAVVFRRHTLLALDDCLYALQATIPHLSRSSLHRRENRAPRAVVAACPRAYLTS
jgi:hypothetical protein